MLGNVIPWADADIRVPVALAAAAFLARINITAEVSDISGCGIRVSIAAET